MREPASKAPVQRRRAGLGRFWPPVFAVVTAVSLSLSAACGEDKPAPPAATAPRIVSQPPLHAVVGDFWAYDVIGEDDEGGPFTLERTRGPENSRITPGTLRIEWTPDTSGNFDFEIALIDSTGFRASQSFTVEVTPRSTGTIAPPLDPAKPCIFDEANSFLFEAENAPQQGVQPGAIKKEFMAVIHGRVFGRDGSPIEGARASVKYHPELGMTRTSSTGEFAFVVNGGGRYVVQLEKTPAYFRVEREIKTEYHTHKQINDVVLIPPSATMSPIQLGAPSMQFARGPMEEDGDGRRQTTVLFPGGTTASAKMPDGTMIPLPALSVRATEFTVGASGPKAMPADLPATSGYTYAVNLTADEAMVMGAGNVVFNQPVPFYVDNFLGFPVGSVVPIGSYDPDSSHWKAEPDGRVVAILGSENGLATVDTNGDGAADDAATLSALGVSSDELQQLAVLYSAGSTLWRSTVQHWTVFDCNWPYGPPVGAMGPPGDLPDPPDAPTNTCDQEGSIIECDDGGLGEEIPIAGTPYRLVYRSRRMPGFAGSRTLDIPLTGATLPSDLAGIAVELEVAGRSYREVFAPNPNLIYHFVWDGRDAFQREVYGRVQVNGRMGYVYRPVYYSPGVTSGTAFGRATSNITIEGGTRSSVDLSNVRAILWRTLPPRTVEYRVPAIGDFGGWTLSAEHRLNDGAKLEMGDGRLLPAISLNPITLAAGAKEFGAPKAIPGHAAAYGQITGIAALPDGRFIVLVCDGSAANLYSVREGEEPEQLLAGGQTLTLSDGRQIDTSHAADANQLCMNSQPKSRLKVDRNSRVLMIFHGYLLRYDPSLRNFDWLAGKGHPYDDAPYQAPQSLTATATALPFNAGLAVGPSDEITISSSRSIFDLVDGRLIPRAGFSPNCATLGSPEAIMSCRESEADGFNGRPALEASFGLIRDLDYAPDGTLFIADNTGDLQGHSNQLRSIRPDGIVRREAGLPRSAPPSPAFWDPSYEPRAATEVPLSGSLDGVAVRSDGIVFISHQPGFPPGNYSTSLIHSLQPGSTLRWEIGRYGDLFDLVPPIDTSIHGVGGGFREISRGFCDVLTFDPRGNILFSAGRNNAGFVRAESNFGLRDLVTVIASPDHFSRLYFDRYGRLLQERSALTALVQREFRRDLAGHLNEIEEQNGDITQIVDRTSSSVAIVGPYGQRTELTFDANGYLKEVRDPIGRTPEMQYKEGGLLRFFTDPKQQSTEYVLDGDGRVQEVKWPNGGTKGLAFDNPVGGRKSTHTSAEGRTTNYETSELNGVFRRKVTDALGHSVSSESTPQRRSIIWPDGTSVTSSIRGTRGEERLGPLVESSEAVLPSGLRLRSSTKRTVVQGENAIQDHVPVERLTTEISRGSGTTTISYVHAQRTLTVSSPAGRVYSTVLDEKDRVVEVRQPGTLPLSLRYDERGRLGFTKQGARTATIGYDSGGHLHDITDPKGQTHIFELDEADQFKAQTQPDQQVVRFAFDPNGNLSEVTPPGRPTHRFVVTETERKVEYSPPPPTETELRIPYVTMLDRDRDFASIMRPSGAQASLMRDAAGRPWILTLPEGNLAIDYYSTSDQLSSITAPNGIRTEFDWDGPLPIEERTMGEVSSAVHWDYDDELQLSLETISMGATPLDFHFDRDGLLTGVGPVSILYELAVVAPSAEVIGAFRADRTYNAYGELETFSAIWDGAPQYSVTLTPDELGRVSIEDETAATEHRTRSYTYYPNGQLHEVFENSARRELYAYDDNGNRTMASVDGVVSIGAYDDQDRLSSYGDWSFGYDLDGRIMSRARGTSEIWSYGYDFRGNLLRVDTPNNGTIEYVIDGTNRRVARKANGIRTDGYVYRGGQLIAELDENNHVRSQFIYGALGHAPIAMRRGETSHAFVLDPRGSVRQVIDTLTGEIEQAIDYDAFGRVLADSNPGFQPFGFAGGIYDPATGWVRFGARDYDSLVGRWTDKDPILFQGQDTNLYVFVGNDPINFIDPAGLLKLPANPSGLSTDWVRDPKHGGGQPHISKWNHVNGQDSLEFHRGQPGKPGERGKDHWHHNGGDEHLHPGDEIPDPVTSCGLDSPLPDIDPYIGLDLGPSSLPQLPTIFIPTPWIPLGPPPPIFVPEPSPFPIPAFLF